MTTSSSLFLEGLTPSYKLHPVVVFSILDHYKRRSAEQNRVIGSLLGYTDEQGVVHITNCFPVSHSESNEQISVDMEYHSNMLKLYERVNSKEKIVGWYTTGDEIDYISSLMHNVYQSQCAQPVHLTVDVALTNHKMGVKAYVGQSIIVKGKPIIARFENAQLDFIAYESEKIGVDALINGQPDDRKLDAPATILSDFDNYQSSMEKLLVMLDKICDYVKGVTSGKIKGDMGIGRAIANALISIPLIKPSTFNNNIQDLLMVVYLANLTRTQIAISDKINGLLQ